MLVAIREHPAVFIAAVNGLALGGGATLVSVCDLAVAADEAEIGMPEIGFGAYPQFSGPGAQIQLTAKRAAWLVLTAQRIDGRTAENWGMVNRSVPLTGLMDEAGRLARLELCRELIPGTWRHEARCYGVCGAYAFPDASA